jgi:hypothetical protein
MGENLRSCNKKEIVTDGDWTYSIVEEIRN